MSSQIVDRKEGHTHVWCLPRVDVVNPVRFQARCFEGVKKVGGDRLCVEVPGVELDNLQVGFFAPSEYRREGCLSLMITKPDGNETTLKR